VVTVYCCILRVHALRKQQETQAHKHVRLQVRLINDVDSLRRRVIAECHKHQAYVRKNTVSDEQAGAAELEPKPAGTTMHVWLQWLLAQVGL
jgi:hypothetical protein